MSGATYRHRACAAVVVVSPDSMWPLVCVRCATTVEKGDLVSDEDEHPTFTWAKTLPEPWRKHFPKSAEEAPAFQPYYSVRPLASRVLVVAKTRVEGAWCAYADAVDGQCHSDEWPAVATHGDKLLESVARAIFPQFEGIPYAE